MRKNFGKWLLAGALAALVLSASPAEAQRDAGAKLRGDAGRYSGRTGGSTPRAISPRAGYALPPGAVARPGYSAVQPGVTSVQPQPVAESDQAYSVVPLEFEVGDNVTVVSDSALLMRGRRAIGSVPPGRQLRVLQIRGPWVGVAAEIDSRNVGGWLWYSHVERADSGE